MVRSHRSPITGARQFSADRCLPFVVAFTFVCAAASFVHGAELLVPTEFATIQGALNFAADGDTVRVDAGTYIEHVDLLGKSITLVSTDGAATTTIDAGGSGTALAMTTGEMGAVVDGFTLTGGTGTTVDVGVTAGGGLLMIGPGSAVVQNCVFEGNSATFGGGLAAAFECELDVIDCQSMNNTGLVGAGVVFGNGGNYALIDSVVSGNAVSDDGGGLAAIEVQLTLDGSMFTANSAIDAGGGAVIVGSVVDIVGCTFDGNTGAWGAGLYSEDDMLDLASSTFIVNNAANGGGGLLIFGPTGRTLSHCTFTGNQAPTGGGLYVDTESPTVLACTIDHNIATQLGGGVYQASASGIWASNLVVANSATLRGGGFYVLGGQPTYVNDTVADNTTTGVLAFGGAFSFDSASASLDNCLLWGNTSAKAATIDATDSSVTAEFSDVEGGYPGDGNFDEDPLFVAEDDYHLLESSPCVGRGAVAAIPVDVTEDIDGGERVVCGLVDVGCDEVELVSCPPAFVRADCDGNQRIDVTDAVASLVELAFGTFEPLCSDACDANDDGAHDLADAVFMLEALFVAESPLPSMPFPHCGVDPTFDALGCETSTCL